MADRWLARIITLAIWALAALCAAFWSLKFVGSTTAPVSAATIAAPPTNSEPTDLARIFGPARGAASASIASTPMAADPRARFVLVGVVANRASLGVALISVEGKAARPYRVGSEIDDSYTLKSVATRSATLAPSSRTGTGFTLELPATTSTVPAAIARPAAVFIPTQPQTQPQTQSPPPPPIPTPTPPPAPVG